ncbi:MAG: DUF4446 family protein [Candidatus Nanopelagicales bacterium]
MNIEFVIALVVAVVAVLVAVVAFSKAARASSEATKARRDYASIARADKDVVDVLLDRISEIDLLSKSVEELSESVKRTKNDLAHSLRHVAVVRFDAFGDQTGRRSFSAAVLDDNGDGIVLTGLQGRTESQAFAKGVTGGHAKGLSPEETEAISHALAGGES